VWRTYDAAVLLREGERFADYLIERRLSAGGMGEVYLARHPRLPRHDALKVLPLEVSADREFRERFHREADLAAALYHPHIVGLHDRGEFAGKLWIAMDYVDGPDTAALLGATPGGLAVSDVCELLGALAEAVDYAHANGLLHRDIKPSNVLTSQPKTGQRRILLTDFGIARRLDEVSGLTATNMTVGTVNYCAPEQLTGQAVDESTDQYALAATAYHWLTGSAPFSHTNPAVVIGQHLTTPPPPLSARLPQFASLDPVFARALAKAPGDRYASCADFAAAFTDAVGADGHPMPLGAARRTRDTDEPSLRQLCVPLMPIRPSRPARP
jgi:serine/threonine protein kinase, bacterial